MNTIHHFVHLGFDGNIDPRYEKAICTRIEGIGEKIRTGVEDIIVLVDEGTSTIKEIHDKAIFRNASIITDFLITNYLLKKRNIGIDCAKMILYDNCPREIIDDLYIFFEGKEETTDRLLMIIKTLKYRPELKNIPRFRKLLGFLQEKSIIIDDIMKTREFEELYMEALKFITRKYGFKNIEDTDQRFVSIDNKEFRERINTVLNENIPNKNIVQMYMQSHDVPFRVCWKGATDLNPINYKYGTGMGDYSKKFLDRIYMIQTQKRIRTDFERVFREIGEKGINPQEVNHILGGEYYHRCVHNYEGFLRWFGKVEKRKINKDLDVSLVHRDDFSML